MQHIKSPTKLILPAKQFIKALKGERIFNHKGWSKCFFEKDIITKIGLEEYEEAIHLQDVRVIGAIVIDEQDISPFTHPIIINNCTFEQDFEINAGVFQKTFRIVRGEFKGRFRVFGGKFQKDFWISGGTYEDSFRIYGGTFKEIKFTKGSFDNGIEIYTANSNSASHIAQLTFKMSAFIKQDVFVRAGTKVDHIQFEEGIATSGRVFIDDITVKSICFNKFVNEGVLEITSLNREKTSSNHTEQKKSSWYAELLLYILLKYLMVSTKHSLNYLKKTLKWFKKLCQKHPSKNFAKSNTFSIINSNMGKTVMRDIDARGFTVEVRDSKLNDITNIGARFPKERQICSKIGKNGKLQHDPKQMAETYSQLYLAIQKQGYRLQELDYYCAYLEWQRKSVKNRIKTDILSYFPAYVSLSFHRLSTGFGRNWLRGIFFSLLIGLIFYVGFINTLPNIDKIIYEYQHPKNNQQMTESKPSSKSQATKMKGGFYVKHYLYFLIPTHKSTFVANQAPGGTASVFDFLGRIILTYLYYQIATASRRFGRK